MIKFSDIQQLLKVFAGPSYDLHIFDLNNKIEFDSKENSPNLSDSSPKVLVNFGERIIQYKHLAINEFDLILNFGSVEETLIDHQQIKLDGIKAPNGHLRWAQPSKLSSPLFLSFFNAINWRGKILSTLIKLGYAMGFKKMLKSQSFSVYYKNELYFQRAAIAKQKQEEFTLFTGTPGAERSPLIGIINSNKISHFLKFSEPKRNNREFRAIRVLSTRKFENVIVPKVELFDHGNILVTSNANEQQKSNELTELHLNAAIELATKNVSIQKLCRTPFYDNILNNLKLAQNEGKYPEEVRKLQLLMDSINPSEMVTSAFAHCDFTPWNCSISQGKLYLYDFEMSNAQIPALFDLFHFTFQSQSFVSKKSFKHIKHKIGKLLEDKNVERFILTYGINVELNYQLYLLSIVSYYLAKFSIQKNRLSTEHQLLISNWNEALNDICPLPKETSCRTIFIQDFYERLQQTPHAFLKLECQSLEQLAPHSDLDLAVLKGDIPSMVNFCKSHEFTSASKVLNKSFMTVVELYFKDGSFLSLDLLHELKRKDLFVMNFKKLLKERKLNTKELNVPDLKHDFEYCLNFYQLNKGNLPEKYQQFFLNSFQADYERRSEVSNYIKYKYNLEFNNLIDLFSAKKSMKKALTSSLKSKNENKGLNAFKNKILYVIDTIKELSSRRGFMISFSGVDGAGKSTIINEIKTKIEKKYRRNVVVLHHRPRLLPILSSITHGAKKAEHIASVTNPRSGKNKNVISSLVRFTYYLCDYILGQFYIRLKYSLRGKIIIYDRYFFDFVSDAKRSNIKLPSSFLARFYSLVDKPKYNFFLHASPEVILQRKQELRKKDVVELTNNYKELFQNCSEKYKNSSYKIIENVHKSRTIDQIMKEFAIAA